VAGLTVADLSRNVGAWRLPLLTSGLLALVFLSSAALTGEIRDRAASATFRIAVDGDLDGGASLLDGLDGGDLVIEAADDAAGMVTGDEVTASLTLPVDADALLESGEPVELTIARRETQHNSVNGSNRLIARLHVLLGTPNRSLFTDEVDISEDAEASRDRFARSVGGFSAFLLLGVVTATAGVLGRTRERRGAEPLLVLPVARRAITTGIALGAMPMAVAFVGTGMAVLLAASMLPLATLGQPAAVLVAALPDVAVATVVLAALGAALGVTAGAAGGGSDDSIGLGDLLTMPVLGLGLALLALPDLPTNAVTLSVPGLGPMLVLRDALLDQGSLVATLWACTATLLSSAALVAAGALALRGERNVRRT
jgi:hypothetical protein